MNTPVPIPVRLERPEPSPIKVAAVTTPTTVILSALISPVLAIPVRLAPSP